MAIYKLSTNSIQASGVTPSTYGDSFNIPIITIDAAGRITSASTTAAAGAVTSVGGAVDNVSNVQLAAAISSSGILTTANVSEVTNLYYTDDRAYANIVAGNFATQSYVSTAISNLIDSAPTTLDTLNELAAALGDDANFASTTATLIGNSYNAANTALSTANTKVATVAGVTSTSISNTNLLDGIKAVDGTGSGLDADTLDGIQATSFLRSDASDEASGQLYFSSAYNRFNTGNSNNTSTADTTGLYLHSSSYTNGQYTTRFRKYDNGGGVPLYIDGSSGTANLFTPLARFGTYSGNGYEFEVFGDINATGTISATDFNSTSDATLKENVSTIVDGVDLLNSLNPVEFTWKENGKKSFGLIAQELEEVLPELVTTNEAGIKGVSYTPIIAWLISGMQQQQREIELLKEELRGLKND